MRHVVAVALAACVLTATVSSCSSSSANATGSRPQTVSLRETDMGRRVVVTDHSTLTVQLDSTYWRFRHPSSVLHLLGVSVHARPGGVPGVGTGTVTARYRAVGAGQAVISAARTSCGEALACSPSQGSYRVTVVVRG